jgi:hypothetical protein
MGRFFRDHALRSTPVPTSPCSVFTGAAQPTEGNEAVMYSTTTVSREFALARPAEAKRQEDTIDTYVWTDEYAFLRSLYDSADNTSPIFRFPDLISACVSLVFHEDNAAELIFDYLRSGQRLARNSDNCALRCRSFFADPDLSP